MLAGVGGLGCLPALSTEIQTPAREDPAGETAVGEGDERSLSAWSDLSLTVRADRQYADLQQNRLVAEGNVWLQLAGGDLAAERVTYEQATGLLTVVGAVRFQRGSQYIQASALRYNLATGEGEIEDAYGVFDFDHHIADLDFRGWQGQSTSQSEAGGANVVPWAEVPPMASANPEGAGPIDQRVHGISPKTGLRLEYRLTLTDRDQVGGTREDNDIEGGEDPVLPAAFGILGESRGLSLDQGEINRWRFQAKILFLTPDGWTSPLVVLTNDPLTPPQVVLEGRDSEVRERPSDGSLILTSATNRALLDGRLPVPLPGRINLNNRLLWALLTDETRRDGFYIERSLAPRSFLGGELTLRPQFMVERALSGEIETDPAGPRSAEADPISVGGFFGLDAHYHRPIGSQGQLQLRTDFSTLAPRHLTEQMRAEANLQHPLTLPLLGETKANLNAAYQLSVWNGSLGEQGVYTAFGGFLEKDVRLPPWKSLRNRLFWRLGLQNINTTVFDTQDLSGKTWRASGYARLTSTLPIWQGETLKDPTEALRYVPRPIRPETSLTSFLIGHSASYGDHSGQRYYTLGMVSNMTMGHFSRPYFDYTKLSVGGSASIVEEISRFSFDRAVDLGLLHVSLTQQLAGPLVLAASASYNVDGGSENYGNRVDSIVELKLQRRAYSAGLFYSPERRLGGLQIRINSFDWEGTGIPFAPYTPSF